MKKASLLLLAVLTMLLIASCATSNSKANPSEPTDTAESSTEPNITEPTETEVLVTAPAAIEPPETELPTTEATIPEQADPEPNSRWGFSSKSLQYQYLAVPTELEDAMTARECSLQPLPDPEAPELAGLWTHHRVRIAYAVLVYDWLTETDSTWYFVSLLPVPDDDSTGGGYSMVGWLPEDCVIPYDASAPLPENAAYCLKEGANYYWFENTSEVLRTNAGEEMDTTAYWISYTDAATGRILLTGYGGATIGVDSMDALEPADFAWFKPSWSSAG